MKRVWQPIFLCGLMSGLMLPGVQAQTLSPAPMPGLWENEVKMTLNGQDILATMNKMREEMLKSLPPEQRAQMATMMKGQGNPLAGGKQPHCMTPEDAARGANVKQAMQDMQKDMRNCRIEPVKAGGNGFSFKGRCDDPNGFTGDIAGEFMLESAKAGQFRYEGKGRMKGMGAMPGMTPSADGLVTMLVQGRSRWVSASCGNVKPVRR